MFLNIAYYQILGKPLIMYGGIITLLCLLFTVTIVVLQKKGIRNIPMKWHNIMAIITLILALMHGILGILINL